MNRETLAAMLHNNEYGEEISKELETQAKAQGLVVCFGYSDDNIEFRGAIYEEVGCWVGEENKERTIYFTKDGSFPDLEEMLNDGVEPDMRKYQCITAKWSASDIHGRHIASWVIQSPMPYSNFNIIEYGEVYCVGCVIDLNDF